MSYPLALMRLGHAVRLEGLIRDGADWKAKCPAHRDNKASLAIRITSEGRLLLHCHAQCSTRDVLRAWGVDWSVLFPDEPEPPAQNGRGPARRSSREPEAVYDYVDEQGALLFQVCRFPGKDFRQRRPLPDGGWSWRLREEDPETGEVKQVRRVLYHLDELVARPDEVVYLCEGEKDADRLREGGLLATTAPQGAGKWRRDYADPLADRRVVVLPDNDDVGRDHARAVVEALHAQAQVQVLELEGLAEHGDVSDWLDAGHNVEELTQRAHTLLTYPLSPVSPVSPVSPMSPAEVRQHLLDGISTARDLMAREFEAVQWAVYNLITEGCTLLVGSPKIGKSWLVLLTALGVAAGEPVLGRSTSRSEVLYLALEDSDRRMHERLGRLLGRAEPPDGLYYHTSWLTIPKGGLELLDLWLRDHPKVGLLIVDTLAAIKGEPRSNSDAYTIDYNTIHSLVRLARHHGCALVVVHHDRKATSEDWLHTVSGTLGLTGAADAILLLRRGRNEADGVLHTTGRDVPEQKLALRFENMRWELLDGDAAEYEMSERRRELLDVLRRAGEPMTARALAEGVEGNREAVKRMLRRMAKDGLVLLTDAGWSLPAASKAGEEGGYMGTPGTRFPPSPNSDDNSDDAAQTHFWTENTDGGRGENEYPASPGTQAGDDAPRHVCPRCGSTESEDGGMSPTAFVPMRKCRLCGTPYIDRHHQEDQQSA